MSEGYNSARMGVEVGKESWKNIELKPEIRVRAEAGKGWMPYGTVGYAINLGDKAKESVNRQMDEMGEEGYFEGSLGVTKNFENGFSVNAQATGRSGAREGIGGIIGEYLGRIFNQSKNRPLYFVDEYNNIKEKNEN